MQFVKLLFSRIGAIAVIAAALLTILGFFIGLGQGEAATEATLKEIAGYLRQSIPPSQQVGPVGDLVTALETGDSREAVAALKSGAQFYEEGPCLPHQREAQLSLGDAVINCESGMRAVFTDTGYSNTYAYFNIGGRRAYSNKPGEPLEAEKGRYPECALVYDRLIDTADGIKAKVSFDCPPKDVP